MPFVNQTQLKGLLGPALITQFEATNPDVLATELIPFADAEVTRITGVQPPDDPESTPPGKSLQMWASWIIHYAMIPFQTLDRDETDFRTSRYTKAMEGLASYEGVTMSTTYTPPAAQISNVKRFGDLP